MRSGADGRAVLRVELEAQALARVDADVVCVGLFEDEQPPRGEAGRADWRLCGLLSDLVAAGRARGRPGEALLVPTFGRLRAPRVLVVGLGARTGFGAARAGEAVHDALLRALDLGAERVVLGPSGPGPAGSWPAALLQAGVGAVRERGRSLRLALRVEPEARAAAARALRDAAADPALRGAALELPPIAEPAPRRPGGRDPAVPTPGGPGPGAHGV